MDPAEIEEILSKVREGALDPSAALEQLAMLPFRDLGHTKVDHHRPLRQGLAEAVYGPGKSPAQCAETVAELLEGGSSPVLLTRADGDQIAAAVERNPHGAVHGTTAVWNPRPPSGRTAGVVVAGTSDLPVATECSVTLRSYGIEVEEFVDVGVAGVHRLTGVLDRLRSLDAIVVVAGMEGALPSVVGGLVLRPVVAVPTSAGYGSSLGGLTALFSMLSSCVPGVTVVGIDNGFGAACAVVRMLAPVSR